MMIRRFFYPLCAICLGMLTTQILATIHVYGTNQELYQATSLLAQSGYLVIPNALVAPTLQSLVVALKGGLFFTMSLGAGLSLFAFMGAWAWGRILKRSKVALIPFLLFWILMMVAVNHRHWLPMVTAYFFAVPWVVFTATFKMMPPVEEKNPWKSVAAALLPLLFLTTMWTVQADRYLFLDIRDFLLLSNPVGQKVDAFYYRYTLYPAHVFKTQEQKTLKTLRVTGTETLREKRRLEALLMDYDYLPVIEDNPRGSVDLEIEKSGSRYAFRHSGKSVFEMSSNVFFAQPKEALHHFSKDTDRYAPFRQATILGLLVGFPGFLYMTVFSLISFCSGWLVSEKWAFWVAPLCCFLAGMLLLSPMADRPEKIDSDNLSALFESDNWRKRVFAMRAVVDRQESQALMNVDERFLSTTHVPERYWYAKALAKSSAPEAHGHLVRLLQDNHPNVVSMALYSLGQRRDKRAIPVIQKHMEHSAHWYNQWYAYRALRSLGWKQRRP